MPAYDITFLICSERSGSNLIRVMLDAHPDVSAPPPLHVLKDIVGNFAGTMKQGVQSNRWPVLRKRMRGSLRKYYDKDLVDKIVGDIEALDDFSAKQVIRSLYGSLVEHQQVKLLFIKEKNVHEHAFLIMDSFPEAKFVFQVRDPRDYLASAKKLRDRAFGNKFGSNRQAFEIWREDQEYGLAALSALGQDRVYLQRYEDLITEPETVLGGLCKFLGLPYDPAMLEYHQQEQTQKSSSMGQRWANLGKEVMSDNAGKYREVLSSRDVKSTEVYLGTLMERFGYKREYPKLKKPGPIDIYLPMVMEVVERHFNAQRTPFYSFESRSFTTQVSKTDVKLDFDYARTPQKPALSSHASTPQPMADLAIQQFVDQARLTPEAAALSVKGDTWTYAELLSAASIVRRRIKTTDGVRSATHIAIHADRTAASYIGILATLLNGSAYVPINPRYPAQRNQSILERSGATFVIFDEANSDDVKSILDGDAVKDTHAIGLKSLKASWEKSPQNGDGAVVPNSSSDEPAYVLFTSGSTGAPKGVSISQSNLTSYLRAAMPLVGAGPNDRFSQTFDLTFDLSVHDLFVCWSSGACLVVPSKEDLDSPADYINREGITQWFSVPSLAHRMRLQRGLDPTSLPGLKMSLFCGEALPLDLAQDWQAAAPNSIVENWYGPTEATIACTRFQLAKSATKNVDSELGLTPIGTPFVGMSAVVLNDDLQPVDDGTSGELFLGGPQVANGYVNDAEKTAAAFVKIAEGASRHYRTGDRAVIRQGVIHYLGRTDHQVKVRGYRIELAEIEQALRTQIPGRNAIALAWPPQSSTKESVLCAVEGAAIDTQPALDGLRQTLPDYMVPANIFFFDSLPTNSSGKADRGQIAAEIEKRLAAGSPPSTTGSTPEDRLLEAIRQTQPQLSEARIKASENLFEAGMDSIGFLRLTLELEDRFRLEMNTERVTELSLLGFAEMAKYLQAPDSVSLSGAASAQDNKKFARRANRAVQFVEGLPAALKQPGPPFVFLLGTSGILRAFSPKAFDKAARNMNPAVRAINMGLFGVDNQGMIRVCEFIVQQCRDHGVRPHSILLELDPMQVCSKPPPGDGALPESVFSGALRSAASGTYPAEFEWDGARFGEVAFDEKKVKKRQQASWETAREKVVAETYAGRIKFRNKSMTAWVSCAKILSGLTDNLFGFVHPIRPGSAVEPANGEQNLYEAMLKQVQHEADIRFVLPHDFDLQDDDFMNINHLNPWQGSPKASKQLVAWIKKQQNH